MVGEGVVMSQPRLLGERRIPAEDLDPGDRSRRRKGVEIPQQLVAVSNRSQPVAFVEPVGRMLVVVGTDANESRQVRSPAP